ncbi:hypothetical protein [Streptomyces olivaceiscleroticus]|uniref:DUF1918 domain-containing protein n=1 Tax=Streptomyces olivaceiscleroticus TaxID=68245 RepID=A0ABP3J805_9ACTN
MGAVEEKGAAPPKGSFAVDTRTAEVGEVMDVIEGTVWLRPPRGGREWEVPCGAARPATAAEVLSAKVAQANSGRRRGR